MICLHATRADTIRSQVFRWSALAFGVVYGAYHQSVISATDKLKENAAVYEHKQSLIQQAKAEFAKKNAPKDSMSSGTSNAPAFRGLEKRLDLAHLPACCQPQSPPHAQKHSINVSLHC